MVDDTPYEREPGYALRYRDVRFVTGSGARTHRREVAAIGRLLAAAGPSSGPWLDMPSGAGRLSRLLPRDVIGVDRDIEMLRAAGTGLRVCASAHSLPWRADAFAGALCMRLLQHIPTAAERIAILSELRRVTRGPLVVSFFDAVSLQHIRRRLSGHLRVRTSRRIAIPARCFRRELAAAGWQVRAEVPLLRFVSEQWLVLAEPRNSQGHGTDDPKPTREDRDGQDFPNGARAPF